MELLKQQVEALIFCTEQSISLEEIKAALQLSFDWELSDEEVISAIDELKNRYQGDEFAFELVEISEGYQFLTKKQYFPAISALIQNKAKKKLSVAQMETLAIIAYRQPISKAEVEHIRGVSCDYAIQKLLEKELIEISGKSDGPGRPVLYSTSRLFMDYFGIKSVKDLPQLKDLHVEQNEIGTSFELADETPESLTESGSGSVEELADQTETVEPLDTTTEIPADEVLSDNGQVFPSVDELNAVEENHDEPDLIDRKSIYLENEERIRSVEESTPEDEE